jgi:hypothetical protein
MQKKNSEIHLELFSYGQNWNFKKKNTFGENNFSTNVSKLTFSPFFKKHSKIIKLSP